MEHIDITKLIKKPAIARDNATLKEVVALMVHEKSNSVLVVDEEGVLVGEVNVVDVMGAIVPEYINSDTVAAHFATEKMFQEAVEDASEKEAASFMRSETQSVQKNAHLMEIAAIAMTRGQARIPVVDENNHPVGVISRLGLKKIISACLGVTEDDA